MTGERWQRVNELFHAAIARGAEERRAFLVKACGGDEVLLREIERLVTAHESAEGFIPDSAFTHAVQLLAGDARRMVGQVLGRYRIDAKVGAGGMAEVYRARDTRLDRDVAIKVLPALVTGDAAARARLVREARAAAALNHPHICTIYEVGEAAGQVYIAMEYLAGRTLSEEIARGAMPQAVALRYGAQVAGALAHAHERGIVHRDLKTSNVVITADGRAKVLDFGLAKRVTAKEVDRPATQSLALLTQAGAVFGTPPYMSPEQLCGKPADTRSDVWALGVVLYEMVAGAHPFQGQTDHELSAAIMSQSPRPLPAQVPAEVRVLVGRCLEKEPGHRYQRAGEVYGMLDAIVLGAAPRRGYVRRLGVLRAARHLPQLAIVGIKRRLSSRTSMIVATAVAAAIFGALAVMPGSSPPDRRRVFVAPFANETGDPALDPVGRMAADWLTLGLLGHSDPAEVLAPESGLANERDAGAAPPARVAELARQAGAGTIVTGSYYRDGGRLFVHARILDATSNEVRFAVGPVSAPLDSVLTAVEALRPRINGAVAALLDENFFGERGTEHMSGPPSLEAYREFVAGRDFFTATRYAESLPHFYRAAALDTGFTWPLIQAIGALSNLGRYPTADSLLQVLLPRRERLSLFEKMFLDYDIAWLQGDGAEMFRVARALNERFPGPLPAYLLASMAMATGRPSLAIRSLEQTTSTTGTMNGWIHYWSVYTAARHILGQHRRELRAALQAREQYTDLPIALELEIRALAALGRTRTVTQRLDLVTRLPPSPDWTPADFMRNAGLEFQAHGHTTAARAAFARGIAWHRSRPAAEQQMPTRRVDIAWLYLLARQDAESEALFRTIAAEQPDNPTWQGCLAVLAIRRGDRVETERIARYMHSLDRPYLFGANHYWQAVIAAQLGRREEAIVMLRDAIARGGYAFDLHRDPLLEPLRGYAPFEELLRPRD